MEVKLVAKEVIKPYSSTPKTFHLSRLDQAIPPDRIKLLLFYQNNSIGNIENVIAEQTFCLKSSLSKVLTLYYPFAGRITDNVCVSLAEDDGVEFFEARVSGTLSQYLMPPKIEVLALHLIPNDKSESGMPPLVIVQASFFACGGLAIGTTISHKVADGANFIPFINEWAKIASGKFDKVLSPDFSASIVFPPVDRVFSTGENQTLVLNTVTNRYVFSASDIASLQEKASKTGVRKPSRVETITAFLWRIGMKMFTARAGGSQRSCILFVPVNLRRMLPSPICDLSFGNLIQVVSVPNNDREIELPNLINLLRGKIAELQEICDNKLLQGKELFNLFTESFQKVLGSLNEPHLVDAFTITSSCGLRIYEADFGWGKPTWACFYNYVCHSVLLMDTRDSTGIQASVSLAKEDMELFASDEELLTYAILDPSVLD